MKWPIIFHTDGAWLAPGLPHQRVVTSPKSVAQALFVALICLASPALAQEARPTVGVAFGGGSARGIAHVGVIRWFEEHHIPIAVAAGTSMGGLIGGTFATGMSSVEIERFQLVNGDCVLLCTNGLTDMIDDARIAEVLALRREPGEQCATLVEMANRAGGGDNVTVLIAEYQIPDR